jgi:hypothetical protein
MRIEIKASITPAFDESARSPAAVTSRIGSVTLERHGEGEALPAPHRRLRDPAAGRARGGPGNPLDPRRDRAVLGAQEKRYLVPPDVDVFELGLIDRPGLHELLPIDPNDKPLWDVVIDLLVSEAEAARQRELLRMAYRTLCG